MTRLTMLAPRLLTVLVPLLLAACPGKEGVLTDASASTSSDTDSAGTTTDVETGPLISTDDSSATTDPHPDTTNATATTTSPFPETSAGTTVEPETGPGTTIEPETGPGTTIEPETTGVDTTTGELFGSEAALYNDCAPNDGPAFRIEIGVTSATCDAPWPTEAQFTITIYQQAPVPAGEYDLMSKGTAILDTGDGSPNFATSGTLTIDSWTADEVTGSYDVTLDDNTHLSGSFAGPYCGGPFLCG